VVARRRVTLTDISSRAWEHPADRGALNALRQLRGFDFVVKKLFALWNERALRLVYVGSAVKVDHRQFARVYQAHMEAAAALDVHDVPDLFVYADPVPRGMTIGLDQPFVVLTSGMVDLLDEDELRFVLGHEIGHAVSGHALYTTMLMRLLTMTGAWSWVPFGALGLRALVAALYEWQRKAELSGDRAGLLATQDPAAALRTHMKLAGGGHLDDLDITAFRSQGEEYLGSPDVRDSVLKLLLLEARSHPFAVVRAAELQRWVDEGAYTRILAGDYPRRGDDGDTSFRQDVKDSTDHYANAFERSQDALVSLLRDVGGGLSGVKDWAASIFSSRPGSGSGSGSGGRSNNNANNDNNDDD
jgi:Zn-dependent protease with chaperone function